MAERPQASDVPTSPARGQTRRVELSPRSTAGKRSGTWVPIGRVLGAVTTLVVIVAGWALLAGSLSASILPAPTMVWSRFVRSVGDGTYFPALGTTVEEAAAGLLVATMVSLPAGYAIGRLRLLEDALAPYLAASQAMPIVAIAPLLVVWVGFGVLPKIIVCALIAFFPMLATTASGVRGVPTELRDSALVAGAGVWTMALYVDAPLAARTIFAGAKVAAALSVTGAVVGEFVSSDQGLGYLINLGRTNFDTPLMFVAQISLMALGALAYAGVSAMERLVLRWDE
jgi:NitT/TauT family transport system permease protein